MGSLSVLFRKMNMWGQPPSAVRRSEAPLAFFRLPVPCGFSASRVKSGVLTRRRMRGDYQ
jgi:hypothetical protein